MGWQSVRRFENGYSNGRDGCQTTEIVRCLLTNTKHYKGALAEYENFVKWAQGKGHPASEFRSWDNWNLTKTKVKLLENLLAELDK